MGQFGLNRLRQAQPERGENNSALPFPFALSLSKGIPISAHYTAAILLDCRSHWALVEQIFGPRILEIDEGAS